MIVVECDRCHTRLKMDPAKIGPKGARVRCVKCQNIFLVQPPQENTSPSSPAPTTTAAPPPPPAPEPAFFEPPVKPPTPVVPAPEALPLAPAADFLVTPSTMENVPVAEPATPPPPAPTKPPSVAADPWAALDGDPFASLGGMDESSKSGRIGPRKGDSAVAKITLTKSDPMASSLSQRNLTPPPTRLPSGKTTSQPLVQHRAPFSQRLIRSSIVTVIAVVGALIGIVALGVKPNPLQLEILWRYGKARLIPGIQVLTFRGVVNNGPSGLRVVNVTGDLLNASDNSSPAPDLRLEVFTSSGEYLARKIAKGMKGEISPNSIGRFGLEVELPPKGEPGLYKVSIEPRRGN